MLLLDSSGSMSEATGSGISKWAVALAVADDFFDRHWSDTNIGLGTFNTELSVLAGFSRDNSSVETKLKELSTNPTDERALVHGQTAIRKAIFSAVRQFGDPGFADSILLITDGRDTPGQNPPNVAQALAAGMVRLFVVFTSQSIGRPTLEEMASPQEISEIATDSGGGVLAGAYADSRSIYLTSPTRDLASLPDQDSYGRPLPWLDQPNSRRVKFGQPLDLSYDAVFRDDLVKIQFASSARSGRLELRFTKDAAHRWKKPQIVYPRSLPTCSASGIPSR